MLKIRLVAIAAIAALSIVFISSSQLVAADQFQDLKNQYLPAQLRNRNITLDEVTKVFKEKCKKVTGTSNSTVFQEVERGAAKLVACFSNLANLTALKQEIEIARPLGELDTVFQKHCQKAPIAEKCFREFNQVIQPCLSKAEKSQNGVMLRIVTGLLDFMCVRGGDHIAMFVAEDGPECLEANKEAISKCANQSFAEFVPREKISDIFNLPDFTLEPEHCVDLAKFESCTLHHLERCREITPVNVAESVFKFVKNETSCIDFLEGKTKSRSILKEPGDSAGHMNTSVYMTVMGAIFALYAKYFM